LQETQLPRQVALQQTPSQHSPVGQSLALVQAWYSRAGGVVGSAVDSAGGAVGCVPGIARIAAGGRTVVAAGGRFVTGAVVCPAAVAARPMASRNTPAMDRMAPSGTIAPALGEAASARRAGPAIVETGNQPMLEMDAVLCGGLDEGDRAMKGNAIRWFEIYVQDMPRARAFYETVFDVRLEKLEGPDGEMLAFQMVPDQPGCGGTIVKMGGVPSGGNSTIVYFAS
jgi:hypothetical protein